MDGSLRNLLHLSALILYARHLSIERHPYFYIKSEYVQYGFTKTMSYGSRCTQEGGLNQIATPFVKER